MLLQRLMKFKKACLVASLLCVGCGATTPGDIAVYQSESVVADRALLIEIANDFYRNHADQYDMLVVWGGPEFGPGSSYYMAVQNGIAGIGYEHEGPEFFDNAQDFGSERLQGIIWMGPSWTTNEEGEGPRSTLVILAQETAHRWGASVYFLDDSKGGSSDALLGDPYHWSFFLDTDASPLRGNDWEHIEGNEYRAVPVDTLEFSQLDLYLMGLISSDEVEPLMLLTNVDGASAPNTRFSRRVIEPFTVTADAQEVTIQQIIDVEGMRDPTQGFNAREIRQAWIYVSASTGGVVESELTMLEQLQAQWNDYFSRAAGSRSVMSTELY